MAKTFKSETHLNVSDKNPLEVVELYFFYENFDDWIYIYVSHSSVDIWQ